MCPISDPDKSGRDKQVPHLSVLRAYDASTGDAIMSLAAAERRIAIADLAAGVGEPVVVLPTVFHLLWHQRLRADLDSALLTMTSPVQIGNLA